MTTGDNTTSHGADAYDADIRNTLPFYDCYFSETVDLVSTALPLVSSWLDTGCGTGAMILAAAKAFPLTRFMAADPSPAMIAKARGNLCFLGAERVRFIEGTTTQELSLVSGEKPQVITAIQSHHYLDKAGREAATRNCHELLEAGGLYVTFENIRPRSTHGLEVALKRWGAFQVAQGRDPALVSEHATRFGRAYFPITLEEHLALLTECGFRASEVFWCSHIQAGFYAFK